ncbi:hatching enzyme 1.2-like [Brienomyrus brachyistius]|uniref:hatching enzyme 1.2-like n=1 Tax=Brienomyrus brachyistius TaxID=42636 RepID=UPI0020B224E0|nr:hatching enzyme 1.2-like [Brienomyrus brachyistius]
MLSAAGVTLLFSALVVVNCYVIKKVPYEEIRHAKHVNISQDDEFTLSTLIEKANKNLGQGLDEPIVKFGDISIPTGFQNADPCTSRGCKWQKKSDGNVYIPYTISNQYSSRERGVILQALQSFSTSTCIRFQQQKRERDYLNIRSLNGCYSFIGRRGGPQDVSLSRSGCVFFGIVQHELIHALGFHHEQNRSDRDRHVRILYENIIRGQEHNFNRVKTNNLKTPYDYNSIMQYGKFAFSRNNQETIRPIPDGNVSIGRATQMSQNDIDRINRLYKCKRFMKKP